MKEIIIVGAGLGGLTAGNLLAKKGHKVTIFESHSMPGGYTAGFYRKGFYFESGTLALEASASVFKAMKDIDVFEQIEFVRQEIRYISKILDSIPENFDDYKKMIYSACPDEEKTLDKFFAEIEKIKRLMNNTEGPAPALFNGFEKIIKSLPYMITGAKLMVSARKYFNMTSSEFLEKYFKKDSMLYKLFTIGYPDMPVLLLCPEWVLNDYWTVKGGMQSWADILAGNFRRLGGDIKLNSYVDRIITKNGAAAGVSCKNKIYNADYVISASDYKKTFLKLLDDQSLIPGKLRDKINKSPVSEGFFTVYIGLNMSNEELVKYLKVPHVYILDDKFDHDIYNSTLVSFYSPSLVNPKHAPEGRSSLMLQAMAPYHWMNNWGGGDPETYKQLKEKVMNAIIDNASKLIPNLKESIEYKDAATPLTYERFTHNTDGASSSWSWNPKNKFYKSPMSVNIKTPVKNLYIGSCWATQNGGIIGALLAAYECVKKIK
ncbi:hypothetical protein DS62_11980 [Smithella sp. SC_K08D17]|nr:hypothetical protein DS62_11980 [Smithella sp. SC_K08D17]